MTYEETLNAIKQGPAKEARDNTRAEVEEGHG